MITGNKNNRVLLISYIQEPFRNGLYAVHDIFRDVERDRRNEREEEDKVKEKLEIR